ncbi:hypothetical protein BIZ53_30540 [Achromobacter xylosoxidans]|nr:hypothetical protein BIZ53_30540 [Achromobacter xylosoxidans]
MPAFSKCICNKRAVTMAICVTQEPEVAVTSLEDLFLRQVLNALQRAADRASAYFSAPWLDHVASKIDASINRLDNGFTRV